jgi:hypothetical protein
MVNVASPTFNWGCRLGRFPMRKRSWPASPRVQKPRRAASFVLWPSSTLAWPWIIHFAIEVVVFCVDHDGERLTTNAPQRCGVGTRVGFTSTPATRREPASTTAFGRRDAEKLGFRARARPAGRISTAAKYSSSPLLSAVQRGSHTLSALQQLSEANAMTLQARG